MSTQQLRAATKAAQEPKSFPELLEVMKPEIARALPRHLNADRMMRIALTEFRKAPKLGNCDLRTVFGAIITLSQLGLEPGILGQAYLIPYGTDCQGIPGWQGLAELVSRAGRASVWTGAVYEGDFFEYAYGDRPFIKHIPDETREDAPGPEKLTHCYAVGRIKDAEWPVIEVWSVAKIRKHRDRFNKVGTKHYSYQHFEMYGRKVTLLQVIKYMPKSVELQTAVDLENAARTGQTIDMDQAKSGTWVPPPEDETGNGGGSTETGSGSNANGGGAKQDLGGAIPQFDEESALAALKKADTLAALDKTWSEILKDYEVTKRKLPDSLEPFHGDRKEALKQKKDQEL